MITAKAVTISLILLVLLSIWTIYFEHFVGGFNSISPPPGAIFLFFVVILFNSLLKSKKIRLRESELILIYSLLLVSAPISSFAVSRFFIAILLAPFYFATPENEFQALFHNAIPSWFAPRDPSVIKGYYEPLGRGVPWGQWLEPLSIWLIFILAAYMLMLCMSMIIHKQWIDRERLTFPTVYLPLQLAEEPTRGSFFNSFLKNKFLWIGFAIPVLIHGVNGLSFHNPAFPRLPVRNSLTRFLTDVPWNAIDQLPVIFYPNVIGFTYLLPVEISFSCWFFYLLSKAGMVLGAAFGWRTTVSTGGLFPFPHHQSAGAFLVLILVTLWSARRFIVSAFRAAFKAQKTSSNTGKQNGIGEGDASLYRLGFVGFVIALAVLAVWFAYVGVKPIVIIGFLALFLIYSLTAGRVRTEAGLGAVSGPIRMDEFLKATIGTRSIGVESLTILAYLRWMTTDLRGFMSAVPCQLESLKMAGKTSRPLRQMSILIFSSVALAFLISWISLLRLSYKNGVYTGGSNSSWTLSRPDETFRILRHSVLNLQGTDWIGVEFVMIGSVIAGIMAYLRTKFLWFPFHPVGYAVGFSRLSMDWIWFSVFIGWGLKLSILKYGGLKLNRKLTPSLLGLVLGDFSMAWFWCIVGTLSGGGSYRVFP